jgi:hypothetical protein
VRSVRRRGHCGRSDVRSFGMGAGRFNCRAPRMNKESPRSPQRPAKVRLEPLEMRQTS